MTPFASQLFHLNNKCITVKKIKLQPCKGSRDTQFAVRKQKYLSNLSNTRQGNNKGTSTQFSSIISSIMPVQQIH